VVQRDSFPYYIHDSVTKYVRDTVREVQTKTIEVQKGRSCWDHVSLCTVGTALAVVGGTWLGVCHNDHNSGLRMCGGKPHIFIENDLNSHSSNSRRKGFTLGFSFPMRP
jgi:hypothetical protein